MVNNNREHIPADCFPSLDAHDFADVLEDGEYDECIVIGFKNLMSRTKDADIRILSNLDPEYHCDGCNVKHQTLEQALQYVLWKLHNNSH